MLKSAPVRLEGKVALITGASRNIGHATALRFAAEGAQLVLSAVSDQSALDGTAEECRAAGADVVSDLADVSKPEDVDRLVKQGLERFGRIDVLVSTVAVRPHTPLLDLSIDEWRQILDINLSGTFYLAKAVVAGMIERKAGSIVAFGGLNAMTGSKGVAPGTAKHGLVGLVRCLAIELAPHNVRVNMVVPGNVDTQRQNDDWYAEPQGHRRSSEAGPLGRPGQPEEIANACLFLASEEASYITGQRLVCNGGRFMG
jgi:3-oxoacyl-[acyl-carrier protein] reductase